MHEVLVNRLGGLSLPRKSVVRLTDRPDMNLDVYRGRKTTIQIQIQKNKFLAFQLFQVTQVVSLLYNFLFHRFILISCVADSKSFWSKLKIIACTRNPNRSVNITSQEWFTHFEQLFADVNQEDSEMLENIIIENTEGELENLVFDADISDDEILQAIKHLKKGKSGGPVGLLPDFFMDSIYILLPVLHKLFNRLFQSGYFPPCWSQSIIVPLHKRVILIVQIITGVFPCWMSLAKFMYLL